jgi:hypothetical protein
MKRLHRAQRVAWKVLSEPMIWSIASAIADALIEKETLTFDEALCIAFEQ